MAFDFLARNSNVSGLGESVTQSCSGKHENSQCPAGCKCMEGIVDCRLGFHKNKISKGFQSK